MLGRFWARRKKTPPPPRLPQLPSAQGRPPRRIGYRLVYQIPPRPSKPRALAEAQARAQRLRRGSSAGRPLRLSRPALHAEHEHPRLPVFVELVGSYVFGEAPRLSLAAPTPFERHAIAAHLDELDRSIEEHRWGHLHRIDDVRSALNLPRPKRSW